MAQMAELRWIRSCNSVGVAMQVGVDGVEDIEPIEEDSVIRVRRDDGSVSTFRGMAETRIWED